LSCDNSADDAAVGAELTAWSVSVVYVMSSDYCWVPWFS